MKADGTRLLDLPFDDVVGVRAGMKFCVLLLQLPLPDLHLM